jgi:DNA replication protein DnaC
MLPKAPAMALASGEGGLDKGATVRIFGPPGVGKSHVGCGIGDVLINAGRRVLCMRTSEWVQRLQAARQSLPLPQALAKFNRYALLTLDDVESNRGKAVARQQQTQRANDKAQRRRQSSGDNDNQTTICHAG